MYADAWATAYNVLGPIEGYDLAVRLAMPVMFILEQKGGGFDAKMTPAFQRLVEDRRVEM
jgi:thiamine biosynthesis lipoprotein ApbE